jgi:hypothetical protein
MKEDTSRPRRKNTSWQPKEDKAITKFISRFDSGKKKDWIGFADFLRANHYVTSDKTNNDIKNRWNNLEKKRQNELKDEEDVNKGGNASLQKRRQLTTRKESEATARLAYASTVLTHVMEQVGAITKKRESTPRKATTKPRLSQKLAQEEEDDGTLDSDDDLVTPQSVQTVTSDDIFLEDNFEVNMEFTPEIIETKGTFGLFWRQRDLDIIIKGRKAKNSGDIKLDVTVTKKKITMECFDGANTTTVDFLTQDFARSVENLKDPKPFHFQLPLPADVDVSKFQRVDTVYVIGIVFTRTSTEDDGDEIVLDFE